MSIWVGIHLFLHVAAAKSLQSCPTLCDPIDGSPPGSPVPGILQARTLEWVAISFSNAWKWKVKVKLLSRVWLLVTPWTAAYQAPLSTGFSRQEYWSGLPLPSPAIVTRGRNILLQTYFIYLYYNTTAIILFLQNFILFLHFSPTLPFSLFSGSFVLLILYFLFSEFCIPSSPFCVLCPFK